jgi:hypothetical protein
MAKVPTFNCELEVGEVTMYGVVSKVERFVSRAGKEKVTLTVRSGETFTLAADGVTMVRTGKDAYA